MKAQTFAPLAFVAATEAFGLLSAELPLGISLDVLNFDKEPSKGPCDECTNVYHPPHHGIDIDDCDNDEADDWHYVHPGKPHYPDQPEHTWGTITETCYETSTIVGCPPDVEYCPGKSTAYTTVTQVESTTICPLPVTTSEYHEPPATKPYVPVVPTTSVYYPPKTTTIYPQEPTFTTKAYVPPPAATSVYVPQPPAETPAYPPPMKETTVWVPPPVVDTPKQPAPPVEEHPAPPAKDYPPVEQPGWVPPPAQTPVVPGGNGTVHPPPPATAGASQLVQSVGVAGFALIAAALL